MPTTQIDDIPVDQTVEISRDIARKWIDTLPEGGEALDRLVTALDYAQAQAEESPQYVLIRIG